MTDSLEEAQAFAAKTLADLAKASPKIATSGPKTKVLEGPVDLEVTYPSKVALKWSARLRLPEGVDPTLVEGALKDLLYKFNPKRDFHKFEESLFDAGAIQVESPYGDEDESDIGGYFPTFVWDFKPPSVTSRIVGSTFEVGIVIACGLHPSEVQSSYSNRVAQAILTRFTK